MRLVDTAIKRPVSVIVGVLFIALFGLISLFRIPVQLTPDVDRPLITVSTVWPGASPEEVEQEIVQRQEEQLKSVEGLVLMTSESNDSRGVVTLEFNVGVDPDAVLLLVSNKLDQVFGYPLDAERPVISAGGSGPSGAITWIMLEPLPDRDDLDIERFRDYGEEVVKTALERVPGVSRSNIYGGYDHQLQVIVDPQAMAARQITVQDLAQALTRENANTSAGTFDEGKRRYIVRTVGQYQQPSDIEQVVVRSADGTRVTVGEIARTRLGYVRTVAAVRQKGRPAIAVNAQRETGANVLEVMDGIRRTIRELNEGPLAREGLHLTQVYDETNYIDSAISLVRSNIIIGGTLAVAVLFIFLRSISSVAIIATSIPISIVGTFLAMWLLGRNINVISLAGMSFAVGMVIDNAIVALENIFRHQQMGKTRVRAALDGASEVWGALLASTLTTVAIFLPIVFVQDEAGQLFRDIAIAVSCSVVLSLIVAISVIPSLANKILGGDKQRGDVLAAWGGRVRNFIAQSVFRISGSTVLRLGVITGLIGLSLVIAWTLLPKSEYLPTGNRNLIFGIVLPPPGYNLDELIQVGQTIEDVLRPHWEAAAAPDSPQAQALSGPPIDNMFFVAFGRSAFMGARSSDPARVRELIPIIHRAGFRRSTRHLRHRTAVKPLSARHWQRTLHRHRDHRSRSGPPPWARRPNLRPSPPSRARCSSPPHPQPRLGQSRSPHPPRPRASRRLGAFGAGHRLGGQRIIRRCSRRWLSVSRRGNRFGAAGRGGLVPHPRH